MVERCKNCKFGKAGRGQLFCQRNAPGRGKVLHDVNFRDYPQFAAWPTVLDDDWCGEWEPENAPPVAVRLMPVPKPVKPPRPVKPVPPPRVFR